MTQVQQHDQKPKSALEHDLAGMLDEVNKRDVIRTLMEQMSSMESTQVLYTTLPACNSEG